MVMNRGTSVKHQCLSENVLYSFQTGIWIEMLYKGKGSDGLFVGRC